MKQGTGSTSSAKFTVPATWRINYAYDCTNAPDTTNFQIYPTSDDPNVLVATVNALTEQGSATARFSTAGTFYLVINTPCRWTISVTA